ncbi:MAG: Hsp33 family molecular chaperone HslO [Pseudomonadota bacterium]
MTDGTKAQWDDIVLPFQLDAADVRGRVARLDETLDQILEQHNYPLPVAAQVAEAAMLTALIGQTIKLRWKLSLQVRGDGPLRLIATDFYAPKVEGAPAEIRAYASFDAERLDLNADPFAQIGKGYFAVLIDQGPDMVPYQGITPIAGGSLSACAETYFAQSEQLPTRFNIAAAMATAPGGGEGWRSGGVMMQHMPKEGMHIAEPDGTEGPLVTAADLLSGDAAEDWNRVNTLLDTAELTELVGPYLEQDRLLLRLFHEEQPRVFEPLPVKFGCTCSEAKVRQSLSIYSAKDIGHMTTVEGTVTADCQFCGKHYVLDPKTVGFEAEGKPDPLKDQSASPAT